VLPLDHVPFYGNAGDLEDAFGELGFQCSPRGFYKSPQYPDAIWETRCIFMERGWLDLLNVSSTSGSEVILPGGCLFLADDLEAAVRTLPDDAITDRYELERRWDDCGNVLEHFELAVLRESPCALPASMISHHWPCDDVDASWTKHPNGAVRLKGVFSRSESQEVDTRSVALQNLLDTSQAMELSNHSFRNRFHDDHASIAIQVSVADLSEAERQFRLSGVRHAIVDDAILVYPDRIGCVFEFTE